MDANPQSVEDSIRGQVSEYRKLQGVANDENFDIFFNLMLKTVAEKMLWCFTSGKDGDNVKTWDDFCKVKGEIVARLQPIQEVYGAEHMIKYLEQQLEQYKQQD